MSQSLVLEWLDENRVRSYPLKSTSDFTIAGTSLTLDKLVLDAYFVYPGTKPPQIKLESIEIYNTALTLRVTGLSPFKLDNYTSSLAPYYIRNAEGSLLVVDSIAPLLNLLVPTTTSTTTAAPVVPYSLFAGGVSATAGMLAVATKVAAPVSLQAVVLNSTDLSSRTYVDTTISIDVNYSWDGTGFAGSGQIDFYTSRVAVPVWPTDFQQATGTGLPVSGNHTTRISQSGVSLGDLIHVVAVYNGLSLSPVSNTLSFYAPLPASAEVHYIVGTAVGNCITANRALTGKGMIVVHPIGTATITTKTLTGTGLLTNETSPVHGTSTAELTVFAMNSVVHSSASVTSAQLKGSGRLTNSASKANGAATASATLTGKGELAAAVNIVVVVPVYGYLRDSTPRMKASVIHGTSTAQLRNSELGGTAAGVAYPHADLSLREIPPENGICTIQPLINDVYETTYWVNSASSSLSLPAGMYTVQYAGGAIRLLDDGLWYVNPSGVYTTVHYAGGAEQPLKEDSLGHSTKAEQEAYYTALITEAYSPQNGGDPGYTFYHEGGEIYLTNYTPANQVVDNSNPPSWLLTPCPFTLAQPCQPGWVPRYATNGSWFCSSTTTISPPSFISPTTPGPDFTTSTTTTPAPI